MKETEFLKHVRRRLAGIPERRPHPGLGNRPVRTLPEDLVMEFRERLEAVGGHVYPVRDAASARVQLRDIVQALRQQGRSLDHAVITGHSLLADLELDVLLHRVGLEVTASTRQETAVELMAQANLGLTGAEYVVAASGTLVMAASPRNPRAASLLPPVHVAVIRPDQFLPDLAALAVRLRQDYPERPPSGFVLVTGPSRTADIEQTLSIGVHGPGELHVLLLLAPDT
ncbi:MAG: lactate utilization protein C [Anaerolineae bacterium]